MLEFLVQIEVFASFSMTIILNTIFASPLSAGYRTPITDLCGKRQVTLDYRHPEHIIKFPAGSATRGGIREQTANTGRYLVSDSNEQFAQQDYSFTNDEFVYSCRWIVTTDSYHIIGAKVKVDNESGYFLSVENESGFIANCTTKSCTFESDTPAVQLNFRSRQVNSQPATRFSAKFFTSPLHSDRGGAAIIALWILLIALTAVLIVFASAIYFFCMKRKPLFTRILTILRLRNNKARTESKKKKITLPNGTKITLENCPRQQRCSVTSLQFSTFERMPTILEETEDNESRASSRQLSETLRKISSLRECTISEKSTPPAAATTTGGNTRTEQMAIAPVTG